MRHFPGLSIIHDREDFIPHVKNFRYDDIKSS